MDDSEVIQAKYLKSLEKAISWIFPIYERIILVDSFTQKVAA